MGISCLSKKCRECPYKDDCQILAPVVVSIGELASAPILIKHDYRNIKVAEGMTIAIDLEDIKKNIVKSMYPNFLKFGA